MLDNVLQDIIREVWEARGFQQNCQYKHSQQASERLTKAVDDLCTYYESQLFDITE